MQVRKAIREGVSRIHPEGNLPEADSKDKCEVRESFRSLSFEPSETYFGFLFRCSPNSSCRECARY
jgi:hypothetical protein